MVLATTGAEIEVESVKAFEIIIGSSILLGGVFIAIGYLISSLVRQRATAAGVAIGVWLAFVVLYDMALLYWWRTKAATFRPRCWTRCCWRTQPTSIAWSLSRAPPACAVRRPGRPQQRDDVGKGRARRRPAALDPFAAVLAARAFSRREL